MPISRKRFSRGNKLTTQHLQPLPAAAFQLNGNITTEEMETKRGTFNLSYHVAVLPGLTSEGYRFLAKENETLNDDGVTHKYGPANAHLTDEHDGRELLLSFTLPPFQDDWDTLMYGKSHKDIVHYLDSMYLSFDQRDEGVVIRNHELTAGIDGATSHDYATPYAPSAYDLNIGLYHKRMGEPEYQGQVIEFDVEGESFIDATYKLNPFVLSGINKEVNPFNTYVLSIKAPHIGDFINQYSDDADASGDIDPDTEITKNQAPYVFLSFNIVLKFKTALVRRDRNIGGAYIQNMPTIHDGEQDPEFVPVITPASNATITADNSHGGLQTNLAMLDKVMLDKLMGGYSEKGERYIGERLKNDACYEVVAVTLFNNGRSIRKGNILAAPFTYADDVGNVFGSIGCRAIIPIRYPMVLHHVVALENMCFPVGIIPSPIMLDPALGGDDVVTKVDVGLASGINANNPRYQALAHGEWNATARQSSVIDTVYGPTNHGANLVAFTPKQYLHSVPLVGDVGDLGSGYRLKQGRPIYVGKSNRNTVTRSQIGNNTIPALGTYAASNTNGEETAIEIRWQINDLDPAGWHRHIDLQGRPCGIVGVCGHVVYLIFKKHLVSCE